MIPSRPQPVVIPGSAGALEGLVEVPVGDGVPAACMVVCHPHPLHGGTMTNKVAATLARSATERGMPALRFNFRGVGASEGRFDDGRGELQDALDAVAWARGRWPGAALWLAGFSFGGYIALRASTALQDAPVRLVTVAPALMRYYAAPEEVAVPACPWLVVQGDADEVIDAATVIDWSRRLQPAPQLSVFPGVGHFFHGQLAALRGVVLPFLG